MSTGTLNPRMQRAADRLAELPTTGPDAVAQFLREHGVKGQRMEPCYCPLAKWIADPERKVGISSQAIDMTCSQTVALPESASWFLAKFDAGEYPDLIEYTTT